MARPEHTSPRERLPWVMVIAGKCNAVYKSPRAVTPTWPLSWQRLRRPRHKKGAPSPSHWRLSISRARWHHCHTALQSRMAIRRWREAFGGGGAAIARAGRQLVHAPSVGHSRARRPAPPKPRLRASETIAGRCPRQGNVLRVGGARPTCAPPAPGRVDDAPRARGPRARSPGFRTRQCRSLQRSGDPPITFNRCKAGGVLSNNETPRKRKLGPSYRVFEMLAPR